MTKKPQENQNQPELTPQQQPAAAQAPQPQAQATRPAQAEQAPPQAAVPAQVVGGASAMVPAQAGETPFATSLRHIIGSCRDQKILNRNLYWAAEACFLVAPAPAVGRIPDGFAITLSPIWVDPDRETYEADKQDKNWVALGKAALDKIAAAAGVSWDPYLCGRLDDGTDPHYCAWKAVGHYIQLDGSPNTLSREKQYDLRDGSSLLLGHKQGWIDAERAFIQEKAETKACLRVVRAAFGLRGKYHKDELATKPFVVARLMFTGESEDPILRRMFAEKMADKAIEGTRRLFGAPQTPAMPALPAPFSPPPVGSVVDKDEDDEKPAAPKVAADGRTIDMPPTSARKPAPPPQAPAQAAKPAEPTGPVCKFGNRKGVPLTKLEDEEIDWYISTLRAAVENPAKERWLALNKADLADANAEYERRNGPPPDAEPSSADEDRV